MRITTPRWIGLGDLTGSEILGTTFTRVAYMPGEIAEIGPIKLEWGPVASVLLFDAPAHGRVLEVRPLGTILAPGMTLVIQTAISSSPMPLPDLDDDDDDDDEDDDEDEDGFDWETGRYRKR